MNHAELFELRRFCSIGGGGLGGIIGSLLGGGLDFLAPEVGVPLALATGGGSFLGQTAQNLFSGEPVGKAVTGGLESGAISGALTGLGEGLTTGNVLAAPGAAATGPLGQLFGGTTASGGVGATPAAAAAPTTAGVTAAPTVAPAAGAGGAPAAGAAGGVSPAGLPATTGAAPADVSGALSTPISLGGNSGGPNILANITDTTGLTNNPPASEASPATITQSIGSAGPITGTSLTMPGAGFGNFNLGDQSFAAGGTGAPSFEAGGATAAGDAAAPTSGSFAPQTLGDRLTSYLTGNPGLLLAGGGLAESILKGNTIPGLSSLKTQAGLEATQGNQNLQAPQTGALPTGAQSAIDQATQAAKATTASEFARLGMTGSTSEAEALSGIDQAASAQKFNDLMSVANLGLSEVGGANSLYQQIMQTKIQQDQQTQEAIARFAAALGGGVGGGNNYKLVAA